MRFEQLQRGQYVNGEWQPSAGKTVDAVVDPATEEVVAKIGSGSENQVHEAIDAARSAYRDWSLAPATDRGNFLRNLATVIDDHRNEFVDMLVRESGKTVSECRGEVDAAMDIIQYHAEWDRRIEGEILPGDSANEIIHLQRHPHGVVAGICPWNYPFVVLARKLAPAMVTGNTLVVKPSEVTPLSTLRLFELIDEKVNVPNGVVNLVTGGGRIGNELVTGDIDMVSMTGSAETGKVVMEAAASNMVKVSLELGGKAPAIVWSDADMDRAVADILEARITNTGQVCTCAERVYVHSDVREEFTRKYVEAAENATVGDPWSDPDVGPHVNAEELAKTESAVERAIDDGARLLTGGNVPKGEAFSRGYWYEPTVLDDIRDHDMDLIQREVFGPVTPIIEINSLEEVIELANDSSYGLSSYLYTNDYNKAMRISQELQFGELYINRSLGEAWHGFHTGWKASGQGGEDGKHGMLEYTQLKTVYHNYQ